MEAYAYWLQAYTRPEAQALASRLGLELPRENTYGFRSGTKYPIRRLIITGEDTPDNMAIFFGPTWKADMERVHRDARIDILLDAPPGSPSHMEAHAMDQGYTGPRKPLEATAEEMEVCTNVRRMQELFFSGQQ